MCCGRAFHARAAATENDRSPRVERRVDGTSRVDVSAERRSKYMVKFVVCPKGCTEHRCETNG